MGSFSIWHWLVVLMFFTPAILGIFVFRQEAIKVRHRESGITKTARLGWSWTYFYFGGFVPIFRGEILIALLHIVISAITLGLFQVIWSFLYNKQHITRLLTSGWTLSDTDSKNEFARNRLNIT